jgi:t-SNARE complex subunit (syntaxin)
MHEVNQETLHYERMIEIKEKEIFVIKGRMVDALKVQEDIKGLVYTQGDKLNVAEENINNANVNVHEAHENLIEGREQHMSSNKKKFCIFGIVTVILLVILIPILIKFT